MSDIEKSDAQKFHDTFMWELTRLSVSEITERRDICASNEAPAAFAKLEAKYGKGSVPSVATYCPTLINEAVKHGAQDRLFKTLVIQQLGKGVYYDEKPYRNASGVVIEDDAATVGTKDLDLLASVASAAAQGQTSYVGVDGSRQALTCPLALDAGATKASKEGKLAADVPTLAKEQVQQMVTTCYDPKATGFAFAPGGPEFPISMIGYAAGQNLGVDYAAGSKRADAAPLPPARPFQAR